MELNLTTLNIPPADLFLLLVSCNKKETDECLKTKGLIQKLIEIKLQ